MSVFRFTCFILVAIWLCLNLLALPVHMVETLIRYLSFANGSCLHELEWQYLRKPELLFEYLTGG